MRKSNRQTLICLTLFTYSSVVSADCDRDLSGLYNNFNGDPSHSLSAPNARTTDDFMAGAKNAIFLSSAGSRFVGSTVDPVSEILGPVADLAASYRVPVCADTGQCAQATIFAETVEEPGRDVGVNLGPVSISIPGRSSYSVTRYFIRVEMGNGQSRTQTVDAPTIRGMDAVGSEFGMPSEGTDEAAQASDGCRDNEGNETGESRTPPSSGGGGGGGGESIPPWEPPNPWDEVYNELPSGQCFACRGTPTGVACRPVARYLCGP